MLGALLLIALGVVLGAGLVTVIYEKAEASDFGQELAALKRAVPPSTDVEDVRIVHRGVPTEDGGDDLL